MQMVFQGADEIITLDLSLWPYWQADQSAYQEGSRDKSDHRAPDPAPYPFIRAGHRYLFKHASRRYSAEFWGEILAYRLGCLLDISVPPAHLALLNDKPGALIEWFYQEGGANAENEETCTLGGEFLLASVEDYDRQKGVRAGHCHNLDDVVAVLQKQNPPNWPQDFTDMLTLDVLIGNRDRHHDNWGIIFKGTKHRPARLTPAFDNGSSLAHEQPEQKLSALLQKADWLKQHASGQKARHHMRLHRADKNGAKYIHLLDAWLQKKPDMRPRVRQLVTFDMQELAKILHDLQQFVLKVPLTKNRAEIMRRIIETRRGMIEKMLESFDA